jgi:tetratricopeptide (TPR) repeat protein
MELQDDIAKAQQLHVQAQQRYIKINAHIKVYGTRNAETERLARNGIEFVEAALKIVPDTPAYLNTYALLVADGLGDTKLALEILEKAAKLAPDDIQIRQNIRDIQASGRVPHSSSVGLVAAVIIILVIIVVAIAASR